MPDLPMAQIPNFQLPHPAAIQAQPGIAQGLSAGIGQGVQLGQQGQQIAIAKQKMNLETNIQIVDSLLKNGLEYPALMKSFWPTIAKSMNSINPAYELDPKKPPENLKGWGSQIVDVLNAHQAGVVSPDQANNAVMGINQDHFPGAIPGHVGMDESGQGTEGPQGPQASQSGPSQAPMLPGQEDYMRAYAAAMNLPPSQVGPALAALKQSPQGMAYQSAIEEQRQRAQSMLSNQLENQKVGRTEFVSGSKDFQQMADDASAFFHLSSQPMPKDFSSMSNEEKEALVYRQKAMLLKYVQMQVPASRRPPNMDALEEMAQSKRLSEKAEEAWNQLFVTGAPLTAKTMNAIRLTGMDIYQSAEKQQSQHERTWAQNMRASGVDPSQVLVDYRPQNLTSTSEFFKKQSADKFPALGHVRKYREGGKVVNRKYLGGNPASSANWGYVGDAG